MLCLDRIFLRLDWLFCAWTEFVVPWLNFFASWLNILCRGWIFSAPTEYCYALTEYFVPWEIILTDPPRSISSQSHPTWVFLPWAFLKVELFSKFRIGQQQPNCPAIMVEMLLFESGAFWQMTTSSPGLQFIGDSLTQTRQQTTCKKATKTCIAVNNNIICEILSGLNTTTKWKSWV